MAIINDWGNKIKTTFMTAARMKATAIVLSKIDVEQIADYLVDYGNKFYKGREEEFINMIYTNLLELVSAVNRRRRALVS